MQIFHYHLVSSKVRELEARYVGKLDERATNEAGLSADGPPTR